MMGKPVPETVNITWPDVLPEDNVEVATALLKELEAQVISIQTYRELRGYDHEKEEERIADEQQSGANLGEMLLGAFEKNGQGLMKREQRQGQQMMRGGTNGRGGQGLNR
jgi:cell division FtsZ-interacting protein ZapD